MDSENYTFELPLLKPLQATVDVLSDFHIRFTLIGGLAIGIRSRPRATADVDFLLEIPSVTLARVLETMQARGFQCDLEATIRAWTTDHLVFLTFDSVRIDWLKPILPIYRHVLEKSRDVSMFDRMIPVASAEGLILTKLIAFRPQDRLDIANLVHINRGKLDVEWMRQEWKALVGDGPDQKWEELSTMLGEPKSS